MTDLQHDLDVVYPLPSAEASLTSAEQLAAADTYNQSAWAILYGALVNGFGVSPQTFQMAYPYAAWNWPTEQLGYVSPAQYDALSAIPAWSAIGKSSSTGTRFNDMYAAFLNVISPDTSDPELRKRIDALYGDLVAAHNLQQRTLQQAKAAYEADTTKDKPGFTQWLGTLDGRSWQAQLSSLGKALDQAQANYDAAVDEAKTPNLKQALSALADRDYYSKLNDPNLSTMPPVPNWTTPTTAAKWANRAATGDVASGGISISNSDAAYDFSKSWAGGSASVGNWFWQVQVAGSWQKIDIFESDASLTASVQFAGIEEILVQPGQWYTGVSALAKGPYKRGYSEFGEGGSTAVFGEKGFLPMVKTGMYVVYRPSFSISVKQATFSAFEQQFSAATGVRIGPFTFGAKGGSQQAGWTASQAGLNFSGKSDSTDPFIIGYTVNVLP